MIQPIDEALKSSKLSSQALDKVILVGGTTRIPIIQKKLREYLGLEILSKDANPEEHVAKGAAKICGMIAKNEKQKFIDITSFAYGIESHTVDDQDMLDVFMPRNTPFGRSIKRRYLTIKNNQRKIIITILQGKENGDPTAKCEKLGQLEVSGLEPRPKGEQGVYVKFTVDKKGKLIVSVENMHGGEP